MPIVVQQGSGFAAPSADSTTTVQNVLDCASRNCRGVLNPNTGATAATDATLLIDYTNEISLDLLRHSRYGFLLSQPVSFTTAATAQGITPQNNRYWVGPAGLNPPGTIDTGLNLPDFDIIKQDTVIDYSNFRRLAKSELQPISQEFTIPAKPRIWQILSSQPGVITLWPAPDAAYTISFRYYKVRNQLSTVNDVIQIPDRYKDILCYGVSWYAFRYLAMPEDAQQYAQLYERGKVQIIKDMNMFPRAEEFMRPDPASVTRQTTTGIGLDSGLETSLP